MNRFRIQLKQILRPVIIKILLSLLINDVEAARPTMQAVVIDSYGGPDVLRLQEFPVPQISRNQVLVRVKAAGINPVDFYMRDGTYVMKPELPAILGKEVAGIVEKVGPFVTLMKTGDRVFCGVNSGGYAEYVAVNEKDCYSLSKNLTFSQGAALYVTYFCAVRGILDKGNLERGQTILIQGASGSFGTAAIQVAKDVGAIVVASVKHHGVERVMKNAGADCVVYHNADNYLRSALLQINRTSFDVILEILGRVDLERDKSVLSKHGRIVVVGNRAQITTYEQSMMTGEPIVYTVTFFKYKKPEKEAAAEFVLNGIRNGAINPLIGSRYKLHEAVKAHTDLSCHNPGENGKPVFILD